jgi:hypothetical protein
MAIASRAVAGGRVSFVFGCLVLALAVRAEARPRIRAFAFPAANDAGWYRSGVGVTFLCDPVQPCPEIQRVVTEGRDQVASAALRSADGTEVRATLSLNIDRTPPRVEVAAPADGAETRDASITIVARAFDALSGLAAASCNGAPAALDDRGTISCTVALLPGVNDVVVEARDLAGNSGSAGIRVARTDEDPALRVVPQVLGLVVGRTQTLHVMDALGPLRDVQWIVDNPMIASVADGTNVLIAKSAGSAVVTALVGGRSASATVTVYPGNAVPPGATRWRTGDVGVIALPPEPPPDVPVPPEQLIESTLRSDGRTIVTTTAASTGAIQWIAAPAVAIGEKTTAIRRQSIGGGLLVVEEKDGIGSALVRTGPAAAGHPWRYQSLGRLEHQLVQDTTGGAAIVEVRPDGFPEYVVFDGRTGTVVGRNAFAFGLDAVRSVGCVAGANAFQPVPMRVGPPKTDGRSAVFETVLAIDMRDYTACDHVSGTLRRRVELIAMRAQGPVIYELGDFTAPADSAAAEIVMLPVAADGRGGLLAPWTVREASDAAPQPRLTHVRADGVVEEFAVPIVGEITRWRDLGSMTDGTTLVTLSATTGQIKWTRVFPKGHIRILPGPDNGVIHIVGPISEMLDEFGRPVK